MRTKTILPFVLSIIAITIILFLLLNKQEDKKVEKVENPTINSLLKDYEENISEYILLCKRYQNDKNIDTLSKAIKIYEKINTLHIKLSTHENEFSAEQVSKFINLQTAY